MTRTQLVLHLGAPKCGSSTLQTALTRQPVLAAANGRQFRYVSLLRRAGVPHMVAGEALQGAGRESVYGYTSFPPLPGAPDLPAYFATIDAARQRGLRDGFAPILSNEAWINSPEPFAAALAAWGHPPVEAVAFLRAPIDWLNAAFWQWGVWSHPEFDRWFNAPRVHYTHADTLEKWAAIPNLRLRVLSGRSDVVTAFAHHLEVRLDPVTAVNRSSPPTLIGFLLRNRRFRPDAHTPEAEFVYQRWCPAPEGRKPWAIRPAHVHAARPAVRHAVETLQRVLPASECRELFTDPRWLNESPYHPDILLGPTPLHRLDEQGRLWNSLAQGISNAARAAGVVPPPLSDPPEADRGDHAAWDLALSEAMEMLLLMDKAARQRRPQPSFARSVRTWFRRSRERPQ